MKTIDGIFSSAASKTFLIFSSASPDKNYNELTEKAVIFLSSSLLRYERMQLAKIVFPHPGEPHNRKPLFGDTLLIDLK
jgi:hypothetical protein